MSSLPLLKILLAGLEFIWTVSIPRSVDISIFQLKHSVILLKVPSRSCRPCRSSTTFKRFHLSTHLHRLVHRMARSHTNNRYYFRNSCCCLHRTLDCSLRYSLRQIKVGSSCHHFLDPLLHRWA